MRRSGRRDGEIEEKSSDPIKSRPRRIDLERKMIILLPHDISSLEVLQERMSKEGIERFVHGSDTIDDACLEYFRACEKEAKEIVPIPRVDVKDISGGVDKGIIYRRPKQYIVFDLKKSPGTSLSYDMDQADENWLKNLNIGKKLPLEDVLFEYLYAIVEYENLHHHGQCSVSSIRQKWTIFNCERTPQESDIYAVIEYWAVKNRDKRQELENPILIQEEKYSELQSLRKMRLDFEKLRVIMDLIGRRERIKKKFMTAHFECLADPEGPLKKKKI